MEEMELRIKQYRQQRGWTQEELANKCNRLNHGVTVSQQYISALEKDSRIHSPTLNMICVIAEALELKCPIQLIHCNCRNCKNCEKK